jgi:palmitoyl-protein thioesterase
MRTSELLLMIDVHPGTEPTTPPGGQFLHTYVKQHNDPPIHNLITFGSQHVGIFDIPPCKPYDLFCLLTRNAACASMYNE